MQMKPLGRSGLSTAPIALGGNVFGWTADEPTSFALLDAFVEAGFNLIDTADVYSRWVPGHQGGESETVIGRWLAARSVLRQYSAQVGDAAMGPQALWLGVRAERKLGDREAEANYGAQLRREHPESMQAQWLISGDYEQAGSLL